MRDKVAIDFAKIKKYCGQDLSFRLQGAIDNLQDSEIKIVNTGMVSSGKSSLYNVLTENTVEERFPTGAARTTTIADSYHYNDVLYIDTPGIDVKDIDDEIAFSTIMKADIVIIIHNIKTGPLTRAESDWIKRIAEAMPGEEARKKRMLFVCTWKDMREKEEGYQNIFDEVCNMVYDVVGTKIPVCDVSVVKYQNGIKKDKPLLCEKSGIPELQKMIDHMVKVYSSVKMRYTIEQYQSVIKEITEILNRKKEADNKNVAEYKIKIEQRFKNKEGTWRNIFDVFKSKRDTYDRLVRELNHI